MQVEILEHYEHSNCVRIYILVAIICMCIHTHVHLYKHKQSYCYVAFYKLVCCSLLVYEETQHKRLNLGHLGYEDYFSPHYLVITLRVSWPQCRKYTTKSVGRICIFAFCWRHHVFLVFHF